MNIPNPSDLDKVLEKITEIAQESATGDYIYRGEPEYYDKVSSNLYREFPEFEEIRFDIARVQENILKEAKAYISKTDDIDETDSIEILTELQHFGGKTNLIDFTEDYLIALFFACDGSHKNPGRVILLKRKSGSEVYKVRKPRRIISRVESQKSVFVESPEGSVKPDIEVTIPADLKFPMLEYLRKHHRISIGTIYNDLHGFIRRSAYTEFFKGMTCQQAASESETPQKKRKYCEKAIEHYSEALELRPDFAEVYFHRGSAYEDQRESDLAVEDYSKAIEMNPNFAFAYRNRGLIYEKKGEVDLAIKDYSKAIELNLDSSLDYSHRGRAYKKKGETNLAIEDYRKAIDLNPYNVSNYHDLVIIWLHQGDWENIESYLTIAQNNGLNIINLFSQYYPTIIDLKKEIAVEVPEDLAAKLYPVNPQS